MKKQPFDLIEDGQQTDRFAQALKQIVNVPKTEVDRRIAEEKKRRGEAKERKRKA